MRASRESIICNLWSCHFDGVGAITSANSKKGLCDWSFIAEHSDSKSFFLFHKGNSDLGPNVQPQFFGPTKLFDPKILFPRWPFLPPPKINVQCVHQKKKKGFSLQFSSLCILHPYSSLETKIELFGNSNCYDFLLFFFFFWENTCLHKIVFLKTPNKLFSFKHCQFRAQNYFYFRGKWEVPWKQTRIFVRHLDSPEGGGTFFWLFMTVVYWNLAKLRWEKTVSFCPLTQFISGYLSSAK